MCKKTEVGEKKKFNMGTVEYSNLFDRCIYTPSRSIDNKTVIKCINQFGATTSMFPFNGENGFAMCHYHYCVIKENNFTGETNTHGTVSCSGAVIRFVDDDESFFNPLTPLQLLLQEMFPLQPAAVEYFNEGSPIDYFYANDIRSTYSKNIQRVTCTDDLKTCLYFEGNETVPVCYGNVGDVHLIHSDMTYCIGIFISFFFTILFGIYILPFLMVVKNIKRKRFLGSFFLIPLLSLGLIIRGVVMGPFLPYVLGNLTIGVIIAPPMIYILKMNYENNGYSKVESTENVDIY